MSEPPDEVLMRAKSLLKVMSGMNAGIAGSDSAVGETSKQASPKHASTANARTDGSTTFKVAVIKGSTLVTTFDDLHKHVEKGSHVSINGTVCQISLASEITSKRVVLTEDFLGATNYEAILTVVDHPKRKRRSPVPKKELPTGISDAVQGLGSVTSGLLKR
jgi:hypothetical protein